MRFVKSSLIVFGSVGLMFLAGCSNENQANNSSNVPTVTPATTNQKSEAGHSQKNHGGQVIETGKYHLELVTLKEANGNHIDFYLLDDKNHEPIPNAKVTAQVQTPNGNQKTLNLVYDAEGKHYAAVLLETASGEYKVAVLSDVKGEKVNGRFTFKR